MKLFHCSCIQRKLNPDNIPFTIKILGLSNEILDFLTWTGMPLPLYKDNTKSKQKFGMLAEHFII